MFYIWLILVGAVVGLIARALMPGRDPIGFIGTIVLGVIGAVLGGFLWDQIAPNNDNQGVAFIPAIIVATILLFIYRKFAGNRGRVV